ncbi:hypothetical protein BJV77DRAFT_1059945 [Russula vinacea]|nr:hypothetical protein BJV77DRAFT_1059945 [Russula vinacea]
MSNLLPDPETGSANPSASLPSLWGYVQPALDHIIRSPTNNLSKAPAVDVNYHMGIHTALYNYFTTHVTSAPPPPSHGAKGTSQPRGSSLPPGHAIYDRLDEYFVDVAREVLLGAPMDDSALVHYLVPCFIRYSTGAQSINRLLNYVNRQYVRRAVDEDKGPHPSGGGGGAATGRDDGRGSTGSHKRIAEKMRERRAAELRRWGAPEGGTAEQLALAEACAEAASAPEHVVPVLSLAYSAFVPSRRERARRRRTRGSRGKTVDEAATGPRGRLARSVKELLESKGGDEEEQNRLACEMADMLMRAGVRPDHPLRRRLRKYCLATT